MISDWLRSSKEAFLIFGVAVAGKNLESTEKAVRKFISSLPPGDSTFLRVKKALANGSLLSLLKESRVGNYSKMYKFLFEVCREAVDGGFDIIGCRDPLALEEFHGVGPKTSRFFLLHTHPDLKLAALDVHILRWLGTKGYDVPKNTPSGARYRVIERQFIAQADKRGMAPADLDATIWLSAAKGIPWRDPLGE